VPSSIPLRILALFLRLIVSAALFIGIFALGRLLIDLLPPFDIWSHMVDHTGHMSEGIRVSESLRIGLYSGYSLIWAGLVVLVQLLGAVREDRRLSRWFGPEYRDYMGQVKGKFFPWWGWTVLILLYAGKQPAGSMGSGIVGTNPQTLSSRS